MKLDRSPHSPIKSGSLSHRVAAQPEPLPTPFTCGWINADLPGSPRCAVVWAHGRLWLALPSGTFQPVKDGRCLAIDGPALASDLYHTPSNLPQTDPYQFSAPI